MNPFELVVVVVSGLLLSVLVSGLLTNSLLFGDDFINELTLKSMVLVYERGSLLNASFNASLNVSGDYLRVTPEEVFLGDSSVSNPGWPVIECVGFDELVISEVGVSCLSL